MMRAFLRKWWPRIWAYVLGQLGLMIGLTAYHLHKLGKTLHWWQQ